MPARVDLTRVALYSSAIHDCKIHHHHQQQQQHNTGGGDLRPASRRRFAGRNVGPSAWVRPVTPHPHSRNP
ncbi:hypothetical protein FOA52_012782 [Chlamydomonas sp. UWO 241]|nr:hypothetical protein FOA52_012782 [Chlamydomonas sp. UWO 241]